MSISKLGQKLALFGASLLLGGSLFAMPAHRQDPQQPPPDNTKNNKRDRDPSEPTADQQKMSAADRDLTKKIRRSIMSDKSLSTYAHNIKIIARDGKVTLKGPVRTLDDKSSIEAKAVAVAGDGNVTNEIEVAPSQQ
jgi:osmotically-inducible protein OsmY